MFHWRLHSFRKTNFKVSPLRYAFKIINQWELTVKLPGSFRLAAGNRHLYRYCIFTEHLVETVLKSLSHSCGPLIKRQGITLPLDDYSYRRRSLALRAVSHSTKAKWPPPLTFQHWSGLSPYTSCCQLAGTCVFDKQSLEIRLLRPNHTEIRSGRSYSEVTTTDLPSSLTRFHSFTLALSRSPTCVGLRYGPNIL